MHLKEQFENLRVEWDKMTADGRVTVIEGMKFIGKVGAAVEHAAETFIGDDAHFEMELAEGRAAYNTYIAPIDIPNVPNFIEGWLDQGIVGGLEEGARYLRKLAIERNPELAQGA